MARGGARGRSGPAPDPNALRRERSDDKGWVVLPVEGRLGDVPDFPLGQYSASELDLWSELWRKPQAVMWEKLGLKFQVAAYVRAFLESVEPDASAGIKTAVIRMEGELGISLPGMASLRWRLSEDELEQKRVEPVKAGVLSARDRLKALNHA
jgi:hypothetical protein